MKILIVTASYNVVRELRDNLEFINRLSDNLDSYQFGIHDVDFLVTGYGSVFTAYHLLKTISMFHYDLAINAGIAGSYDYFIEQGSVVNVVQDQFADLGYEDSDSFFTLGEKELLEENQFPFSGEIMHNLGSFNIEVVDSLFPVKAITLNSLKANMERIQKIKAKFNCEIETMEGGSFFYVCLMEKIPFLQIRAISYFVELQKVENWNIPLAVKNLCYVLYEILQELQ